MLRLTESENAIRYSKMEQKLFKLMPRNGKKISTKMLKERYYAAEQEEEPFAARSIINSSLKALIEKIRRNKEPFIIQHTGRHGPNAAEIWIEEQ